jgi:hypothetical protein
MATKPKSYKKDGYIYTESSPGSNKFQNFTAAKPTVKKVRDDSRADKAKVAAKKVSTSKPGESMMASSEATRPTVKAVRDESRMAKAEATRNPSRGQEKRYPSAEDRKMATVGQSKRFRSAPMTKGVSGKDAKGKRGVGRRMNYYFGYPMGTYAPIGD